MQVSIQTERRKKNNFSAALQNSFGQTPEKNSSKIEQNSMIDKQFVYNFVVQETENQETNPNKSLVDLDTQETKRLIDQENQQATQQATRQILVCFSVLVWAITTAKVAVKHKEIAVERIQANLDVQERVAQFEGQVNPNIIPRQNRIKMLQNKIKMQDTAIEQMQKQIKLLRNMKQVQEKQLQVFQNDQMRRNAQQLQKQVKSLKQKLKISRKQTQKRQQLQKKQHIYYMQLQRMIRKQNDQYYPGKQTKSIGFKEPSSLQQEITERQWQSTRKQLADLKKQHQDTNRKIELLTRQRNKEQKSSQQNQDKLRDKLKKLHQVKNKLSELTKLVTINEKKQGGQGQNPDEEQQGYEAIMKNGKKKYKQKNPNKERQVKKWVIPQGYALQKGKIMPDSIFFSDKTVLKSVNKSKIIQVRVWTDSQSTPCLLQFIYSCQKGKRHQGIQPYPNSISQLQQNIVTLKEGDYIHKLQGKMDNGYLMSVTFFSKFGQRKTFLNESSSSGQSFKFQPRPNELPSCLFGAIVKTQDDQIRICHIGCQFIEDW